MTWIRNINLRNKYYSNTSVEAPAKLLLKAISHTRDKSALDIGCGSGVDTKELMRKGFNIIAVDVNSDVLNYFSQEDLKKTKIIIQPIEDFTFDHYDLIYAKSSLVFLSPKKFSSVIEKIKNALNENGIFAARLWGLNDSENKSGKNFKRTFLTKEKINELFKGWKFILFKEIEKDRKNVLGQVKHWHFLDIIVQKC